MKYLKMLGLAAIAAMGLMAFLGASSASATVLCPTTPAAGTDCSAPLGVGAELDFSVEETARLKTSGGTTIATCTEGTSKGPIGSAGSTTSTVSGNISELTWGGCTTSVHTLEGHNGSLEVHHIAGTDNGTVTSFGSQVTITFLGVTCTFETNPTTGTDIGTLTGSGSTGGAATFDISATIPEVSHNFGCPSSGIWSGAYVATGTNTNYNVAAG